MIRVCIWRRRAQEEALVAERSKKWAARVPFPMQAHMRCFLSCRCVHGVLCTIVEVPFWQGDFVYLGTWVHLSSRRVFLLRSVVCERNHGPRPLSGSLPRFADAAPQCSGLGLQSAGNLGVAVAVLQPQALRVPSAADSSASHACPSAMQLGLRGPVCGRSTPSPGGARARLRRDACTAEPGSALCAAAPPKSHAHLRRPTFFLVAGAGRDSS